MKAAQEKTMRLFHLVAAAAIALSVLLAPALAPQDRYELRFGIAAIDEIVDVVAIDWGIAHADTSTAIDAATDSIVETVAEELHLIDVGPIIDWGLLFIVIVGPAGIYFVAVRYLKIKAVADNREIVLGALEKAVAFGVAKARGRLLDLGKIETRNEVVAAASSYAISAVPDALRKLGIGPEGLRDRLIARTEEYLRFEPTPEDTVAGDTTAGDSVAG